MMAGDQAKDRIDVLVKGKTAIALVYGRGSFKTSPSLKDFGTGVFEQGCNKLVIDLGHCVGMDSTFMGVIAGICCKFRRRDGAEVVVARASDKLYKLMSTLGLNRLLTISSGDDSGVVDARKGVEVKPLEAQERSETEYAELMLEAHELLVEVDPGNQPRFKDVVSYLRDDLMQRRSTGQ